MLATIPENIIKLALKRDKRAALSSFCSSKVSGQVANAVFSFLRIVLVNEFLILDLIECDDQKLLEIVCLKKKIIGLEHRQVVI